MNQESESFVAISDLAHWEAFKADNCEALAAIADDETLLRLALNCELLMGGGAAPLIRVGFVDDVAPIPPD